MGLSFDLISEFVKITNDKKESPKEGTVYATVVSGTGGKYVKIDGSDLLTPMETTTDIEDGERVTLMIKDHKAVVMGNVSNPSASTGKVDKVTDSITSVSERVGTFELVVADKVSTNELEAYKATIEVLIAGKATIEDLTATNAKIENLEVKNAEIENLVAEKATIKDLEVVNATIENLKVKDAEIENAVVENLKATTADIKILNADFAQIKTLVNGNLTSDNILSFNLTSEKVTVDDAFIKDAMIDTISAGKINAGKINTNSVSIGSEDGGMLITGSTQQFTDKNGNVRIQIGKDASGDFTFVLYGEDGTGQLINQNGITASAIGDGLIVNNMVSDNAAISGGKLDISSVITEINGDTSTTIKSSKIYLNEQQQSLEVAFNSLKTKVDTIQEVTIQGDLTAIVEQVQSNASKIEMNSESINTLISEDTVIKKQVTDLKGTLEETETTLTSKYTSLNQSLDGFKTTVADTYATKSSVTDVVDNLSTNYSTTSTMNSAIEQKAQEISASVSSTYATKNEVKTLDDNIKTNYSTTQQMESAINVAKEEINLGVSTIYETKENTTSKINSAVNNIKVGGTNLWSETTWEDGALMDDGFASDYWLRPHVHNPEYIDVSGNNYLTYQVWNPNGIVNATNYNRIIEYNSNREVLGHIIVPTLNGEIHQTYTWEIPGGVKYIRLGIISDIEGGGYNTSLKFKIEFGNKPTEWSPNPLDIANNITTAKNDAITSANNNTSAVIQNYYTKAQTDSQINIAKDEINLGVSSLRTEMTSINYTNLLWNSDFLLAGTNGFPKGYLSTDPSFVLPGDWICPQGGKTILVNTLETNTTWCGFASPRITVNKDQVFTASVYVATDNIDAIDTYLGLEIQWWASDGSRINVSGTTFKPSANNTWERFKITGTAPEGAVSADICCWNQHKGCTWWGKPMIQLGGTCTAWDRGGDFDNINDRLSNAELKITDDSIIATVSGVYETKTEVANKIGALDFDNTNYVRNSGFSIGVDYYGTNGGEFQLIDVPEAVTGKGIQIRGAGNNGLYQHIIDAPSGDYTVSFYLRTPCENPVRMHSRWEGFSEEIDFIATNEWTRVSYKVSKHGGDMRAIVFYLLNNDENNNIIQIHSIKAEKGNKVTKWTPNPLDVNTNINNAKNDAITSANNTLNSTIANYYTREETNSQINIAKDAINLGVSQTYETKESVTSKVNNAVNNIKIGGTNLISKKTGYAHGYISPVNGEEINSGASLNENQDFYTTEYLFVKRGTPISFASYPKQGVTSTIQNAVSIHIYNTDRVWQWSCENISNNPNEIASVTYTTEGDCYIRLTARGYHDYNHMAEFSNKPSEWRPSPKDVDVNVEVAVGNVHVGGTNLWVLSDITTGWENVGDIYNDGVSSHQTRQSIIPTNGAKELIYQCWNPNRYTNFDNLNRVAFFDVNRSHIVSITLNQLNGDAYQCQKIDIPGNAAYMRLAAICGPSSTYSYDPTIKIKFEIGNKPTDYSLAPEDIESEFSTIQSETRMIKETVTSLQLGTDSINASVKSLQESLISTANGLASDITSVQEQVNLAMTSDEVKIEIQKELKNGASKVSTSTGFTFDETGLNISKTDSEMKTQITEDGMKIYKNNDIMLTANNQGVDAKNLHATTYLIIGGNSRMEDFIEGGGKRTAVFWIG